MNTRICICTVKYKNIKFSKKLFLYNRGIDFKVMLKQ